MPGPGGAFQQVGVQAVVKGFGPYMRNLGKMDTRTKGFGGTLGSLGKTAAAMGVGFIAAQASIAGVQSIMSKSIGAAMKFEAQLAEIRALTGATAEDTEFLAGAIKDMAREMPKSPAELGAAAYFILSSGIEDAADAAEVLDVAARASTIGLGETAAVADALTTVLNAYGKSADEAGQVTDVMIEAVKQGKAEADAFAGVLGRVVPLAAQMGISFEEVAANLATFTRLGVSADLAATGLRQVMASLLKPTEDQVEAMEELGFSAEGLRQQIKDKGLLVTLDAMMKATGGNEAAVARLFPNIRALTSVLGTVGVQMEDYTDILAATTNASGNLEEGFAIVAETAQFKLQRAMNQLNVALMDLGTVALPVVVRVAERLSDLIEKLEDFAGPVEDVIGATNIAADSAERADTSFSLWDTVMAGITLNLGRFKKEAFDAAGLTSHLSAEIDRQSDVLERDAEALRKTGKTTHDVAKETTEFDTQVAALATRLGLNEQALRDSGLSIEELRGDTKELSDEVARSPAAWQAFDKAIAESDSLALDFAADMENEVGPAAVIALEDIEQAADDTRSALTSMFRETTIEEADAELALANLKLEAGLLEEKTDDLTAAEAARLTKINDELIPAQESNLDLLQLQKDAVEKHAQAQNKALTPMEEWRKKVGEQLGVVSDLDFQLRHLKPETLAKITVSIQGFEISELQRKLLAGVTIGAVGAQHGFHGDVVRPTLFLAGEAGKRERVDITPQTQPILAPSVIPQAAAAAGGGVDPDTLAGAVAAALQGLTVVMDGRIVGSLVNDRIGDRTSMLGRGG